MKLKKTYDSFVEMKVIENGPDELLEKRCGAGSSQSLRRSEEHCQLDRKAEQVTVQRCQMQRRGSQQQQYEIGRSLTKIYAGSTHLVDTVNLETVASMDYGGHDEPAGSKMSEIPLFFTMEISARWTPDWKRGVGRGGD